MAERRAWHRYAVQRSGNFERVLGEAGGKKKHLSGKAVDDGSVLPARLPDHPPQKGEEEYYAKRETPTGMHGEAVQSGEEAEHREDEAVSQDGRSVSPPVSILDGRPAFERVCQGESELDGAGLGGAGTREPGDASGIDAIGTFPICKSDEKPPAPPDVSYEATGLVLRDGLSYERWTEIGCTLQQMERSVAWWIGDWLLYGERCYGERCYQAVEETTGYKLDRIRNYAWVAEKVPDSTRVASLPWTMHREVAALEPEQQVEMLALAETQGLSTRELHEAVKPRAACAHEFEFRCKRCGAREAP